MEKVETSVITPHTILAIYRAGDRRDYHIESHAVRNGKVLAGVPLQRNSLRNMAKAILKKDKDFSFGFRGLSPKNLLTFKVVYGNAHLLWSVPAQTRKMFFSKELGIPNGEAYQPDLIFCSTGCSLSVFAYIDDGKGLSSSTKLFIPPYHNVSDAGSVCLGTAKRKKRHLIEDMMAEWENVFYNSYFSHAGGLYQKLTFNINSFWKKMIETRERFPVDVLVPTNLTLGDILTEYFETNTEDVDQDDD